MRLEQNTWFK